MQFPTQVFGSVSRGSVQISYTRPPSFFAKYPIFFSRLIGSVGAVALYCKDKIIDDREREGGREGEKEREKEREVEGSCVCAKSIESENTLNAVSTTIMACGIVIRKR